jgi:hypothetical protein
MEIPYSLGYLKKTLLSYQLSRKPSFLGAPWHENLVFSWKCNFSIINIVRTVSYGEEEARKIQSRTLPVLDRVPSVF